MSALISDWSLYVFKAFSLFFLGMRLNECKLFFLSETAETPAIENASDIFGNVNRGGLPCLCQPSEEPTELEGQHPRRNCQYTRWYAGAGHGKHQKSVYSVFGQWRTSPTWYDFQNCVKQNFKYVLSLSNKNKTYMIYKTYFIAFRKKEVMLPHPE